MPPTNPLEDNQHQLPSVVTPGSVHQRPLGTQQTVFEASLPAIEEAISYIRSFDPTHIDYSTVPTSTTMATVLYNAPAAFIDPFTPDAVGPPVTPNLKNICERKDVITDIAIHSAPPHPVHGSEDDGSYYLWATDKM